MKKCKKFVIALLLVCVLTGMVKVNAYTPIVCELPAKDQQAVEEMLSLRVLESDIGNLPLTSICINQDNGWIAISGDGATYDQIKIIDTAGQYLIGYEFFVDGIFYIDWDGTAIVIYCIRDDVAITISMDGKILSCKEFVKTAETTEYFNHLDSEVCYDSDGNLYRLGFASFRSKLLLMPDCIRLRDVYGGETVLYEYEQEMWPAAIENVIGIAGGAVLCAAVVLFAFCRNKRTKT